MNQERFRAIMEQIRREPKTWNQHFYHEGTIGRCAEIDSSRFLTEEPEHKCGTSHCVAGWAQIHSKRPGLAPEVGRQWLDLTDDEVDFLFCPSRTLEELEAVERGELLPDGMPF